MKKTNVGLLKLHINRKIHAEAEETTFAELARRYGVSSTAIKKRWVDHEEVISRPFGNELTVRSFNVLKAAGFLNEDDVLCEFLKNPVFVNRARNSGRQTQSEISEWCRSKIIQRIT